MNVVSSLYQRYLPWCLVLLASLALLPTHTASAQLRLVVLDPGHGGEENEGTRSNATGAL